MRNPSRIKTVLEELEKLWELYPDLRLGQLLLNVLQDPELYYIEDEKLIQILKEHYTNSGSTHMVKI